MSRSSGITDSWHVRGLGVSSTHDHLRDTVLVLGHAHELTGAHALLDRGATEAAHAIAELLGRQESTPTWSRARVHILDGEKSIDGYIHRF